MTKVPDPRKAVLSLNVIAEEKHCMFDHEDRLNSVENGLRKVKTLSVKTSPYDIKKSLRTICQSFQSVLQSGTMNRIEGSDMDALVSYITKVIRSSSNTIILSNNPNLAERTIMSTVAYVTMEREAEITKQIANDSDDESALSSPQYGIALSPSLGSGPYKDGIVRFAYEKSLDITDTVWISPDREDIAPIHELLEEYFIGSTAYKHRFILYHLPYTDTSTYTEHLNFIRESIDTCNKQHTVFQIYPRNFKSLHEVKEAHGDSEIPDDIHDVCIWIEFDEEANTDGSSVREGHLHSVYDKQNSLKVSVDFTYDVDNSLHGNVDEENKVVSLRPRPSKRLKYVTNSFDVESED